MWGEGGHLLLFSSVSSSLIFLSSRCTSVSLYLLVLKVAVGSDAPRPGGVVSVTGFLAGVCSPLHWVSAPPLTVVSDQF